MSEYLQNIELPILDTQSVKDCFSCELAEILPINEKLTTFPPEIQIEKRRGCHTFFEFHMLDTIFSEMTYIVENFFESLIWKLLILNKQILNLHYLKATSYQCTLFGINRL